MKGANMLKKLIILLLAVILLVPVTGFCQRQVRSLEKEPLPFVGAEDLIYGSYLNLIGWTMDNGSYSLRKKGGRMKFIRLIEVFDSPYIFCNTNIKTPKIRKIYFQVLTTNLSCLHDPCRFLNRQPEAGQQLLQAKVEHVALICGRRLERL